MRRRRVIGHPADDLVDVSFAVGPFVAVMPSAQNGLVQPLI